MRTLRIACVTAVVAGIAAAPAFAALSQADRTFAEKAAAANLAEIQEAQLAQQKTSSPQVKQLASRIITDHTQANNELQQIAQQENITLPSQPDREATAALQKLRGLNGPAFDKAYAEEQVRDHQQAIALFRTEANSGQDPALKSFAQKTLPILQQHLQMAEAASAGK